MNAATDLHSSMADVAKRSEAIIQATMDSLASAKLFDVSQCPTHKGSYGVFDHVCNQNDPMIRRPPAIVGDQQLRDLRHIHGQHANDHVFASCPDCTFTWTNQSLLESYLKHTLRHFGLTKYPDSVKRLKALAIQYQKGNLSPEDSVIMPIVIDAAYNHHMHTGSCFACKAKKVKEKDKPATRKRKRGRREMKREECRYRFPTCPSRYTRIRNLSAFIVKWFSWDGTFSPRQIKELVLRRHPYDAFQNGCCRAISHSRLACNSNLQFVNQGPLTIYTFYYTFKGTQGNETSKYVSLSDKVQESLEAEKEANHNSSNFRSARSKAIRMVLRGSYSHLKGNIVSATMASFLIRNGTRFLFSHTISWCPLNDLIAVLKSEKSFTTLRQVDGRPYFNNAALHYLCRPAELSHVNVHDFYCDYDVVNVSKQRKASQQVFQFENGTFQHPSYQVESKCMLQCIVERSKSHIARVQQYDFPDTATFGGSILDPSTKTTDDTNEYAKRVLTLFLPFRCLSDLEGSRGYTETLRTFASTTLLSDRAKRWLQNLQDCHSNGMRLSQVEDELEQCTECYDDANGEPLETSDDPLEDAVEVVNETLDAILHNFEFELDHDDGIDVDMDSNGDLTIRKYSVETLRQQGRNNCGYANLSRMALQSVQKPIWIAAIEQPSIDQPVDSTVPTTSNRPPENYSRNHELATLLLERVSYQQRTFTRISSALARVNVLQPNGSARSIVDWGHKANLDRDQQKAFETFAAYYVMTHHDPHDLSTPAILLAEYANLSILSGALARGSKQLICLLHGPGGSGKPTVIDLLLTYAREFCDSLEYDDFDADYSIVVTAMSGVATKRGNDPWCFVSEPRSAIYS